MADGSAERRLRAISGGEEAGGADPARVESWIGSGAVEPTEEPVGGVIGAAAVESPAVRKERHLRLVDGADKVDGASEGNRDIEAGRTRAAGTAFEAGTVEDADTVDGSAGQVDDFEAVQTIKSVPEPATMAPQPRSEPSRHRHRRVAVGEEILTLLAIVGIGTAVAVMIDAVIGDFDGAPLIHPLVLLALPTWDLLPRNVLARMGLVAVEVAAIVGCWVLIAALGGSAAWRSAPSFGLACLLVGSVHVLAIAAAARRRRTSADAVP